MDSMAESALRDVWQHVTSDRQAWLLGAGVSCEAGIPLMYPLTDYVETLVREESASQAELLKAVRDQLSAGSHIEHVLSQLGDLISLAVRSKSHEVSIQQITANVDGLRSLHDLIREKIGYAVRYGYRPRQGEQAELRGTPTNPIVTVDDHRAFVRRLFAARIKPGFQQSPISFFTINYDTLLEDALALEQISYVDGFIGGAMAYWSPSLAYGEGKIAHCRARVFKLHGSVDWHSSEDGVVIRCRDGCTYPSRKDSLFIHPQSTKYVATQKDPFAGLFTSFRTTLATGPDNVLGICGYSFGDDHVDNEIEAVMSPNQSKTVIVAFAEERESEGLFQLPKTLQLWLKERPWRERVFVASSKGLYHGSLENLLPESGGLSWWRFQGLTDYLADGPEILPANSDEEQLNETTAVKEPKV